MFQCTAEAITESPEPRVLRQFINQPFLFAHLITIPHAHLATAHTM